MKEVKQRPKFRCDFCRRASTKGAMEKHEKICWKNPNRFCDYCKNTGKVVEFYEEGIGTLEEPCIYCSQRKTKFVCPKEGLPGHEYGCPECEPPTPPTA